MPLYLLVPIVILLGLLALGFLIGFFSCAVWCYYSFKEDLKFKGSRTIFYGSLLICLACAGISYGLVMAIMALLK